MTGESLFEKVWKLHAVAELPTGQTQLFIGMHLVHEVTSPQAFDMLRESGAGVAFPKRTFATVDHIIPTDEGRARPFKDAMAEKMIAALEKNAKESNITLFNLGDARQGIVHVIGPELGLTQPGMTIVCGDSHTSTHGALGALAFAIGTTQLRDVLATQCVAVSKPKTRRIEINGAMRKGVYSKDVILAIIRKLGVGAGSGYAYEYAGSAIEGMSIEERMTVCNMSIEGGATVGYVSPDEKTFEYIRGRPYAPPEESYDLAVRYWKSVASDPDARYDDTCTIDAASLEPMVTWGINPGQAVGISERLPPLSGFPEAERANAEKAYKYMGVAPGEELAGKRIDVAFIGSCTNSRISDLREAAAILSGRKVSGHVKALAVPGSSSVKALAEREGIDRIFKEAGFEWRSAGCSMCLGMNPDKLVGTQLCASSSNRNYIGRQGSPTGRTMLMSPAMVAAAAIEGKVTDVRDME
ncbi:MAG: 3-isopropylmalate dehydratase large subunit [Candidatus Marsarchaeota archaeon]|nr:3-isopropylmalate dehydratase large subunit [Candidatus Marsarchaeota archaeon]